MPRHADHDARRRQLADAALHVALDQGLDRVSVPRIAAQAGVSVGLVQHYFPAKAALVVSAYERLAADTDERIAAIVAAGERRGDPIRRMAPQALAQLLPLDEPRAEQARMRAEFAARALRDEALERVGAAMAHRLLARLAAVVDNGRVCGETAAGLDADAAALDLLGLTHGLAALGLLGAAAEAPAALAAASARIFPGECAGMAPAPDALNH